jgi:ABC-type phosphate/phosphonate transport system substrate-binding protein
MIAALPMYDWPEERVANDALWSRFAAHLKTNGVAAPDSLTRQGDLHAIWTSPDLLMAQTCSYPLETALAGKVAYVATPSYAAPGCDMPGHYRSVLLMSGHNASAPVPGHAGAALPDWRRGAKLAFNAPDSMSGWHALARDLEAVGRSMPEFHVETGSHRASLIAVAEGRADIAAIDCVSFAMALRHEPAAHHVHVAGWTALRPGLPLITAFGDDAHTMSALRAAAIATMSAVVLTRPTER